jgi:outer membrane protein OmpA-like peptidoglycan-associated protein
MVLGASYSGRKEKISEGAKLMTKSKVRHFASAAILTFITFTLLSTEVAAQKVKVEGLIKGRSGDIMILQTTAEPYVNVRLTDSTTVAQVQGVFKARKKEMAMAALVPGLSVKVEASLDANQMLVARNVTFKGNDLEQAYAIQAGLSETEARSKQNQEEVAKHQAELEKQNAALKKHQAQLTEHEEKIAANKALIAANTARFGQLDDYYIYDEVTVLFGNGKVNVDPQYDSQLMALAQKAQSVEGYMTQVKGYASASGSAALNQKLSEQRASAVTNILLQRARVPLSRMLAPGAMGESQAKESAQEADEANDRKVVVRVLQNKGIAGL